MSDPIHILSLGAGVQSSALALMSVYGNFGLPRLNCAIFADTGREPESVMKWLDFLETQLPFPVHRVRKGDLGADECRVRLSAKSGKRYLKGSIPAFVLNPDGTKGLLGRKCTSDYKIIPLQAKVRELVGISRQGAGVVRAKMWIGISTDEAHRMKPSRVDYIENTWPLIDLGFSRKKCLEWMKGYRFPEPPRSACYFCPFHGNAEWRRLRDEEPAEFSKAVAFEKDMQEAQRNQEVLIGVPFLHRSCKPLDAVNLDDDKSAYAQLEMFGNECEGMCGV